MGRDYLVRVATLRDEAAVSRLLRASYPVLMKADYDDAVLNAALGSMTRANPELLGSGTYYVAQSRDRRVVGCGGWTHERPGSRELQPGLAHIRHFATHPDWTGRGIGRSLYTLGEGEARLVGVRCFECYASLNAEGFYAALGFARISRTEIPMGEGVRLPSILMRKSI